MEWNANNGTNLQHSPWYLQKEEKNKCVCSHDSITCGHPYNERNPLLHVSIMTVRMHYL